ncbi:MAG: amino acid synthesis family protein [Chromatiales bacterium]|jgi:hypothetical protein|nr:amino acid synthesis family protein [Chromatiales bacterium]
MSIRKTAIYSETLFAEAGRPGQREITRVAGIAVVENPLAGIYAADLSVLFDIGGDVGTQLMSAVMSRLQRPVESYGKAAIVGVAGEFEHGGACIHPKLGKRMRSAIGGGKAVISSNVKVAAAGASIDVPLGHKDEPWSFDHFDTLTVCVADAPRPNEIVIVVAVADGGRLSPRCGDGPIT